MGPLQFQCFSTYSAKKRRKTSSRRNCEVSKNHERMQQGAYKGVKQYFLSLTATVTILEAAALCSKVEDYESQIPATAQNVT